MNIIGMRGLTCIGSCSGNMPYVVEKTDMNRDSSSPQAEYQHRGK